MVTLNSPCLTSLSPFRNPEIHVLKPNLLFLVSLTSAQIYEIYSQRLKQMLETNAAVINISGRQRMLSQRVAFYSTQLIAAPKDRHDSLKQELGKILDLMEFSHAGLLYGDTKLKLSGYHSRDIFKIYHLAPYHLDRQVKDFIGAGRELIAANSDVLNFKNKVFQKIVTAASGSLLNALDVAVSQYQMEKEQIDLAIDMYQAQLYQESLAAQAIAEEKAEELKQAIAKLETTQLQLVQSEKLSTLGYLSAGLAHEINNPLNFIYGNLVHAQQQVSDLMTFLDLIETSQRDPVLDTAREELEIDYLRQDLPNIMVSMLSGAERIRNLILDLKKFSRKDPKHKESLNLHEILDTSLVILHHRLEMDKPITVIKKYGEIPNIFCHISQINQVFLNIINNAIDAVQKINRVAEIIITSQSVTDENNQRIVRIIIEDNGEGISLEAQKRLFEPFYTTKTRGNGTGLGLSISRQIIVDSHQGNLQCISQENIGTTFIVDLPVETRSLGIENLVET